MLATQEPKYEFNQHGNIVNRKTRIWIPADEPILILRAKDKNSALAIAYYKKLCTNDAHKAAINIRLHDYVSFAHNNPEVMKEPDTDL